MKLAKLILYWIIGLMFIATGTLKLIHFDTMSIAIFDRAHYPDWLFYTVAIFELVGGVLFIIKKTRQYGTMLLGTIMVGAIWTHYYLRDDFAHMVAPMCIIILMAASILRIKAKENKEKAA